MKNAGRLFGAAAVVGGAALGMGAVPAFAADMVQPVETQPPGKTEAGIETADKGMGASSYPATQAGVDAAKADADAARTRSDEANAALSAAQKKVGETARAEEAAKKASDDAASSAASAKDASQTDIDRAKVELDRAKSALDEETERKNAAQKEANAAKATADEDAASRDAAQSDFNATEKKVAAAQTDRIDRERDKVRIQEDIQRAEEAERLLKDGQGGMKRPLGDEQSIDKLKADLAATEKAIAELTEILNGGDAMIERKYRALEAATTKAAASKAKFDEALRKLDVARRSWSGAEADYKDKERAHGSLVSQHRAYVDAQERARSAGAAYDRARTETEAAKRALEDARVKAQRASAEATDALDAYAKVLAEFSMKQSDEQKTPGVQKKADDQKTPDTQKKMDEQRIPGTQKKVGKHSAEGIAARHASQTEGASGSAKASDAVAGSERQSTMAVARNDMSRSAGSVSGGTMRASASLPQTGDEAGGFALAAALGASAFAAAAASRFRGRLRKGDR